MPQPIRRKNRLARAIVWVALLVALVIFPRIGARAQQPWYEGFEGPETSWANLGGDGQFEVLGHGRVRVEAFTGNGCEQIRINGNRGTHLYFGHPLGNARVIDELLVTLRVKSNRAGPQILARVVLPRTTNAQTGKPRTTLLRGTVYTTAGSWQQLRVDNLVERLERQTRAIRAETGSAVDPKEAYVDQLLLNVYGGPGETVVWIDDLDAAGHISTHRASSDWGSAGSGQATGAPETSGATPPRDSATGLSRDRVRFDGSVLLVEGRPTFPRVIRHRGEPLEFLKRLGFTAVWLPEAADRAILEEATRLGLWLIGQPPSVSGSSYVDDPASRPLPIGPRYGCVLVWDLGSRLATPELATTKTLAERVRSADRNHRRPMICQPESDLWKYSRYADLLLVGRSPVGSSLELARYGDWIRQRPRLALPGTPIWTTVQTQPARSIRAQWLGLGCGEEAPLAVAGEQIRLLAYTAITAGSRGLVFDSESPLDGSDPSTQSRARTLELINLEIASVEPLLAAGTFLGTVDGSEPGVVGLVMRTERARLLVPVWSAPRAQFVTGQSAANRVAFLVPGVPETYKAYEVLPGGLRPLQHTRETGGTRVMLDEFGLTSLVLLTAEPRIAAQLERNTVNTGRRAAQLQHDLAKAKLETARRLGRQPGRNATNRPAASWLATAEEVLGQCGAALATGEYQRAYRLAQRAMRGLRLLERARWEAAVESLPSPVSSPAAITIETLPAHRAMIGRIESAAVEPNRLPGGDFEDNEAMLRAGWHHFHRRLDGVHAAADLAPAAARTGRYGLRLVAKTDQADLAELIAESPPSWMRSPPVAVQPGDLILIRGWAHVPEPITGSVDGLLVFDSLAGQPLAERIGQTSGWQEFSLYRVVTDQDVCTVTFALSGLGEAWLDDITVQVVYSNRPTSGPSRKGVSSFDGEADSRSADAR